MAAVSGAKVIYCIRDEGETFGVKDKGTLTVMASNKFQLEAFKAFKKCSQRLGCPTYDWYMMKEGSRETVQEGLDKVIKLLGVELEEEFQYVTLIDMTQVGFQVEQARFRVKLSPEGDSVPTRLIGWGKDPRSADQVMIGALAKPAWAMVKLSALHSMLAGLGWRPTRLLYACMVRANSANLTFAAALDCDCMKGVSCWEEYLSRAEVAGYRSLRQESNLIGSVAFSVSNRKGWFKEYVLREVAFPELLRRRMLVNLQAIILDCTARRLTDPDDLLRQSIAQLLTNGSCESDESYVLWLCGAVDRGDRMLTAMMEGRKVLHCTLEFMLTIYHGLKGKHGCAFCATAYKLLALNQLVGLELEVAVCVALAIEMDFKVTYISENQAVGALKQLAVPSRSGPAHQVHQKISVQWRRTAMSQQKLRAQIKEECETEPEELDKAVALLGSSEARTGANWGVVQIEMVKAYYLRLMNEYESVEQDEEAADELAEKDKILVGQLSRSLNQLGEREMAQELREAEHWSELAVPMQKASEFVSRKSSEAEHLAASALAKATRTVMLTWLMNPDNDNLFEAIKENKMNVLSERVRRAEMPEQSRAMAAELVSNAFA